MIGTPEILYKSNILPNKDILIKDHLLYRVPLFNFLNLFRIIFLDNKNYKGINISSLKQALKLKVDKRNIFLGLYSLDPNKINCSSFLKFLLNKEIIVFSQIYLGNGLGEYSCRISLDHSKKPKLSKVRLLTKNEWIQILRLFLGNFLMPIPFKFKTKFGSSYHTYGSLLNEKDNLKIDNKFKNKIHFIDSSVLNEIDSETSSFKIMRNSVKNVQKFIKILPFNNS